MPGNYLHPGVYVEEVSSGVRPIEGASTSTAGFVGLTAKGVPNRATFVTSYAEFVRKFGDLVAGSFLPYAVQQFYANGGKRCYIVRVLNALTSATAGRDFPDRETDGAARSVLRIDADGAGAWGNAVRVQVEDGTASPTAEFKLLVFHEDPIVPVEVFDNLSMDPASDGYVVTAVNDASEYVRVRDLGNRTAQANPTRTTTNPLAVDPVAIPVGGLTVTLELSDGTTLPVNFAAGNVGRAALVTQLANAWQAAGVTAALDATNRVVVRGSAPGFDRYFLISGNATAAGAPLEGLAGFTQGSGAATGAVLKSAAAATFNTTGGNNVLTLTVHGVALPNINLTADAALTLDQALGEIDAALRATANGLVAVSREGDRLVLTTANRGNDDSDLVAAGTANTPLQFNNLARTAANTTGFGRSEPAFAQSAPGPFALTPNSNFRIRVNNGALGAPSADITVTFTTANVANLAATTAQRVVELINAAAPAATVQAALVNDRVVLRQTRRGPAYTLQVIDGQGSPNVQIRFDTAVQHGWSEGEPGSPYYRPGFNPDAQGANQPRELLGGGDGTTPSSFDFIGTPATKAGLHALDDVVDVSFIAIPGNFGEQVIGDALGYCQNRGDCFFIADPPGRVTAETAATDPPHAQDFVRNRLTVKSSYGALYYPWLEIADPIGAGRNPRRFVPPSGFVAGLYARIDNTRGVWKAPAGTEANLIGALGLEYSVTDAEQDILNPVGVNCIRRFPASGLVIWGARTLATQSDPEYRYVPVRRYTIYLEVSIYRGTQWAVFEPNDETLWESLEANIRDFMMGEFRAGALAGVTPDEAFRVKCDRDLNPESEVNAGRVNMEVKFAPLKPAEFVVIRISQKSRQAEG